MAINNRVKITNDIELKDRLVAINRVTKVTKGGRTFSFSAIVVVQITGQKQYRNFFYSHIKFNITFTKV